MISAAAREYVTAHFAEGVAQYLLGGDGFKAVPAHGMENLAALWQSFFEELAAAGYMRRSQTGRYWWL